jgi:hypothetical protein
MHNSTYWLQAGAQMHNSTFWFQARALMHNSIPIGYRCEHKHCTFWLQARTLQLYFFVAGASTNAQLYLLVTGASTDEAGFAHSIVPHQNTLDEFLNKDNQF